MTVDNPLGQWRHEIDTLDTQLLMALAARQQVVLKIGAYKKEHGLPSLDPARWQAVLASRKALGEAHGLCPDFIQGLYNLIHDYSLELESE